MDKIPKYPLCFVKEYKGIRSPISFVEERPIEIEGVKPDHYTINNFGEVYNYKGQLIKPCLINSGYYVYRLYTGEEDPKYIHKLAHRLVKQVFDPINNFDEMTVNHISMNRDNNKLSNLEYLTQAENNAEKEINHSNSGTCNKDAKFDRLQLRTIVEEIDKGTPYRKILEIINIPYSDNNCDSIGNIKRGITYRKETEQIRKELGSTTN